jgi:alkanesulfonate monooxygenase SsuD/methylene tetrahydromethanopterin reductase-like flavin-dependent oxidoreductase (luciferase family)
VICAGQGWSEDEYAVSGVPFQQRTGRTMEVIQVLEALWGPDPVEFNGKYYQVPSARFNPKPVQKPRPPLLMASFAPAAVARAARLTDGFNPIGRPNAADNEKTIRAELEAWRAAGREPARPEIIVRVNHTVISDQPVEANRPSLTGSVEQVREDVRQLGEWGVTEIFFSSQPGYGQPDYLPLQLDLLTKLRGVV